MSLEFREQEITIHHAPEDQAAVLFPVIQAEARYTVHLQAEAMAGAVEDFDNKYSPKYP